DTDRDMSAFHPLLLAPTVAALLAGVLGTLVGARPVTLRQLLWGAMAATAGAGVAAAALGGEYLGSGTTGGTAIAAIGGLVGAAVAGRILSDSPMAGRRRRRGDRAAVADAPRPGWPVRVAVCVVVAGVAIAVAGVGAAPAAVGGLVLRAAAWLTRRRR